MFAVIVGNVGIVYEGKDENEATTTYREYVQQSDSGHGRAGGEPVAILKDGDLFLYRYGIVRE